MRTDFNTFRPGDIVLANKKHPYYNSMWLGDQDIYTIDQMIPDAGQVTLIGIDSRKTFPDDIFILLEKADETNSSNEGS